MFPLFFPVLILAIKTVLQISCFWMTIMDSGFPRSSVSGSSRASVSRETSTTHFVSWRLSLQPGPFNSNSTVCFRACLLMFAFPPDPVKAASICPPLFSFSSHRRGDHAPNKHQAAHCGSTPESCGFKKRHVPPVVINDPERASAASPFRLDCK